MAVGYKSKCEAVQWASLFSLLSTGQNMLVIK